MASISKSVRAGIATMHTGSTSATSANVDTIPTCSGYIVVAG